MQSGNAILVEIVCDGVTDRYPRETLWPNLLYKAQYSAGTILRGAHIVQFSNVKSRLTCLFALFINQSSNHLLRMRITYSLLGYGKRQIRLESFPTPHPVTHNRTLYTSHLYLATTSTPRSHAGRKQNLISWTEEDEIFLYIQSVCTLSSRCSLHLALFGTNRLIHINSIGSLNKLRINRVALFCTIVFSDALPFFSSTASVFIMQRI